MTGMAWVSTYPATASIAPYDGVKRGALAIDATVSSVAAPPKAPPKRFVIRLASASRKRNQNKERSSLMSVMYAAMPVPIRWNAVRGTSRGSSCPVRGLTSSRRVSRSCESSRLGTEVSTVSAASISWPSSSSIADQLSARRGEPISI